MVERLARIGMLESEGRAAIVDMFDGSSLSEATLKCLRDKVPVPTEKVTPAKLSVNLKHYAAYLDMLRHGHKYAMVVEDDAAFETGSKQSEDLHTGSKSVSFDVSKTYVHPMTGEPSKGFHDSIVNVVANLLPEETFEVLNPARDYSPLHVDQAAVQSGATTPLQHSSFHFDTLMLGACDNHWSAMYNFGAWVNENAKRRKGTNRTNAHITRLQGRSCSRCMIGYLISLRGAVRMLERESLPFWVSIDNWVDLVHSKRMDAGRGPMSCLWAEPPVIWENPGPEGDGLFDADKYYAPPTSNIGGGGGGGPLSSNSSGSERPETATRQNDGGRTGKTKNTHGTSTTTHQQHQHQRPGQHTAKGAQTRRPDLVGALAQKKKQYR
jgi:GR25 family glycosyltransferase involved in LPS biosynthesis